MQDCWIFDMDGTLANSDHRKKWVTHSPKNWPAWNAGMAYDPPHMDIVQFTNIAVDKGLAVIICSGREDVYRDVTENWLVKYNVPFTKAYLRKKGDYRDDSIVKKELLADIRADGYNPLLAFDDRDRVVKAWRECGIRCLQVAEGNF